MLRRTYGKIFLRRRGAVTIRRSKEKGLLDEHATGRSVAASIRTDSGFSYDLSFYHYWAESVTRSPLRNLSQDKEAHLSHHVPLLAQHLRRWLWAGRRGRHCHYLRVRPQLGALCQRRGSDRGRHHQHGSDYGVLS